MDITNQNNQTNFTDSNTPLRPITPEPFSPTQNNISFIFQNEKHRTTFNDTRMALKLIRCSLNSPQKIKSLKDVYEKYQDGPSQLRPKLSPQQLPAKKKSEPSLEE